MHHPIPEQGKWLRQIIHGISPTSQFPQTAGQFERSGMQWPISGDERFGGAARRMASPGTHGEAVERLAPQAEDPSSLALGALRRQTPKVGAECPNWARSDLCGGTG